MCVANVTQFMLYYYASFKHLWYNNSTKLFWKERTCFLFQSQEDANVSVNFFHNAELNVKGFELG